MPPESRKYQVSLGTVETPVAQGAITMAIARWAGAYFARRRVPDGRRPSRCILVYATARVTRLGSETPYPCA